MAVQRVFAVIAGLLAACAAPRDVPMTHDAGDPAKTPADAQPADAAAARTVRFVDEKGVRIANPRVRLTIDKQWIDVEGDDFGRIQMPAGKLDRMRVCAPGRATSVFFPADLSPTYATVLVLSKASGIELTIRDQAGQLVIGQLVEAIASDDRTADDRHAERIGVRTNADGVAVFDDLGDTTYWLTAYEWQIWGSTDLYDVQATMARPAQVNATVTGKSRDECVEVLVTNLKHVTWRDASCNELAIQVRDYNRLHSIYTPGRNFVLGDPGEQLHVRLIEVKDSHIAPNGWTSEWQPATVGQTWPLVLDARH